MNVKTTTLPINFFAEGLNNKGVMKEPNNNN